MSTLSSVQFSRSVVSDSLGPHESILLRHKRNEITTHAIMPGNLENIYLSERSWTQKVTHCVIPLRHLEESTETENSLVFSRGRGRRMGELVFSGYRGFIGDDD